MRKGISPFIASVLLIAFTVAVAGILGGWYTSFTKTSTETVKEHAEEELTCAYGGINLYDVTYSNGNVSGIIRNTGTITLGDIDIRIICTNGAIYFKDLNKTLDPGEEDTFNVTAGCASLQQIKKVRVETNCSKVYDDIEGNEIST